MEAILLISTLLLSVVWYMVEWYQKNRKANREKDITEKVSASERARILSHKDYTEIRHYQQPGGYNPHGLMGSGRLYYSIPGRSFRGRIWNGQIYSTDSYGILI